MVEAQPPAIVNQQSTKNKQLSCADIRAKPQHESEEVLDLLRFDASLALSKNALLQHEQRLEISQKFEDYLNIYIKHPDTTRNVFGNEFNSKGKKNSPFENLIDCLIFLDSKFYFNPEKKKLHEERKKKLGAVIANCADDIWADKKQSVEFKKFVKDKCTKANLENKKAWLYINSEKKELSRKSKILAGAGVDNSGQNRSIATKLSQRL